MNKLAINLLRAAYGSLIVSVIIFVFHIIAYFAFRSVFLENWLVSVLPICCIFIALIFGGLLAVAAVCLFKEVEDA